jgi:hypothetical protein
LNDVFSFLANGLGFPVFYLTYTSLALILLMGLRIQGESLLKKAVEFRTQTGYQSFCSMSPSVEREKELPEVESCGVEGEGCWGSER